MSKKVKVFTDLKSEKEIFDRLNKKLLEYVERGGELYKGFQLLYNKDNKVKSKDVFTHYLKSDPIVRQLKTVLDSVPNLRTIYGKPRNYASYNRGQVLFAFGQLYDLEEKDLNSTAKKPLYKVDGKKLIKEQYNVATVCDKNGNKYPTTSGKIRLTEESYISFGFSSELVTQAKLFYIELTKIANTRMFDDDKQLKKLFNSIYSFNMYFDQHFKRNKTVSKLEGDELAIYKNLMAYKYDIYRDYIIEKCCNIISKLDNITDYITQDKHEELLASTDKSLSISDYNFAEVQSTISNASIGIPYAVTNKLKELKILPLLKMHLPEECVDLTVDMVSDILAGSLQKKANLSSANLNLFRSSPYNSLDGKNIYNLATKYNEKVTPLQESISKFLFEEALAGQQVGGEKLMVILDSTLINSVAQGISQNSISLDKNGTFNKCFKFSLMQLNNGVPVLMETSNSSLKDVSDFIGFVDKLKELKIDLDQITLCTDAGYFSQENLVYAQSMKLDFLMLARDISIVKQSIIEAPRANIVTCYNQQYGVSLFNKVIKFSDYLNPKASYVSSVQQKISKYNKDFKLHYIHDDKLKIVNIYNPSVATTEISCLQESFTDYKTLHKDVTNLKDLARTKFRSCFTVEDDKLVFNNSKIEELIDLCGYNSIITNMADTDDLKLLQSYKKRMSIEHSFMLLKSYFEMKSFRKHLNITQAWKCLVNWLALVVYNSYFADFNRLDESSSVDSLHKYFRKKANPVDEILLALHNGLEVSFRGYEARPEYKILDTKTKRALKVLGLDEPEYYNFGVGFVESSTRYKKYNEELLKNLQDKEKGKIDEETFKIKVSKRSIIGKFNN